MLGGSIRILWIGHEVVCDMMLYRCHFSVDVVLALECQTEDEIVPLKFRCLSALLLDKGCDADSGE